MILMISSEGTTIDSRANARFGRTPYFIRYDLENQTWEAFSNQAANQSGGAGVAASQFLIDKGTMVAISGRFGPNAYQVLNSAGIKMMTFDDSSQMVSEIVEAYASGQLKEIK